MDRDGGPGGPASRAKARLSVLRAIAEFERGRIVEWVRAGLLRTKAHGKRLGRRKADVPLERLATGAHLARTLGAPRRRVPLDAEAAATGATDASAVLDPAIPIA